MDFATSSGLAFVSGINAYLPLLSYALAVDLWPERFHIDPQYGFLTQIWFMVILAILTLADFVADKIPGVDHVWDLIHTVLRPVAGALVAVVVSHASGGWLPVVLALGGGLAAATHVTKASVRVTSTVTTAGCLNIVLSLAEDLFAALSIVLSLTQPTIMLIIVGIFVLAFLIFVPRIIRSFRRVRQKKAAASGQGGA